MDVPILSCNKLWSPRVLRFPPSRYHASFRHNTRHKSLLTHTYALSSSNGRNNTPQESQWGSYLALIGVSILWGSYSPILKLIYDQPIPPDPAFVLATKGLISSSILLPVALFSPPTGAVDREARARARIGNKRASRVFTSFRRSSVDIPAFHDSRVDLRQSKSNGKRRVVYRSMRKKKNGFGCVTTSRGSIIVLNVLLADENGLVFC